MPPNDEVKTRISAEDQFSEVYKKLIELEKKLEQQTDQTGAAIPFYPGPACIPERCLGVDLTAACFELCRGVHTGCKVVVL